MKKGILRSGAGERAYEGPFPCEEYESVEFSIAGLQYLHQFRLWNMASGSLCVLVKEGSEILGSLKEGDVLPLKYYTRDEISPTRYQETEISNIRKEEEGRFRGHYLVALRIPQPGRRGEERLAASGGVRWTASIPRVAAGNLALVPD